MHDGRLASLYEVARHYLGDRRRGAGGDPLLPTHVARGTDLDDLVAFLRALTSDRVPGEAPADPPARVDRTRLRFVDANGAPLAGREVVLEPAGQELPDADGAWILRTTDADGWIEHAPPRSTHVRVRLDAGMRPQGGAWIPRCARGLRCGFRSADGAARCAVRRGSPAAGRGRAARRGRDDLPRPHVADDVAPARERTLEDGWVGRALHGRRAQRPVLGVGRWFLGDLSPRRGPSSCTSTASTSRRSISRGDGAWGTTSRPRRLPAARSSRFPPRDEPRRDLARGSGPRLGRRRGLRPAGRPVAGRARRSPPWRGPSAS